METDKVANIEIKYKHANIYKCSAKLDSRDLN